MHGPLPAERTPLDRAGQPSHSLTHAFRVAVPTAVGRARIHHRSRHASECRNRAGSLADTISA